MILCGTNYIAGVCSVMGVDFDNYKKGCYFAGNLLKCFASLYLVRGYFEHFQ